MVSSSLKDSLKTPIFRESLSIEGSNLLLYGLGSKYSLLEKMSDFLFEKSFNVMTVNGFLPTCSVQEIVTNILGVIPGKRPKGVIGLQAQVCRSCSCPDRVLNSLDWILCHDLRAYLIDVTLSKPSQLEFINAYFSKGTSEHLFVLVNCIDAAPLTTLKSLQALETLASAPMLHFIGTVNHINAPLLWDLNRARAMR